MAFEITPFYLENLRNLINSNNDKEVTSLFKEVHYADIAEVLDEVSFDDAIYIIKLLDSEKTSEILMELDEDIREKILENLSAKEIAEEVEEMDSDDAADIIGELSEERQERVINALEDDELVADIKVGKGTLGKILVEEDIADEVKQTLSSVNKIVGRVSDIRTELSGFMGAGTESGSTTTGALRIFPSPERFYILGLSSSNYGPESEKETTRIVGGVTTTETEKVKKKDVFRFDVQIGRKLHDLYVRGGIIESTGGVGLDYDLFNGATRLSFDMFDYRDSVGPNLRLSTEVQLWNVFYGKISGVDLATKDRSGLFSLGLRFNDEDIKGLLGFFL